MAKKFRSATATIMYLMQLSHPQVYNATRNCLRMMSNAQQEHWKSLVHFLKYVTGTPDRGLTLAPNRIWNGDMNFELRIVGRSDSDYAANTDDQRGISGSRVFIEGAPACFQSARVNLLIRKTLI